MNTITAEHAKHARLDAPPRLLRVLRLRFLVISLAVAALSAAQGRQTFTGVITDNMCDKGDHSRMRMGSTDAECTTACVEAHGASYVLYDGRNVYTLSAPERSKLLEQFAGQKVRVVGTLDAKTRTIRVDSITPAK